MNTSVPSFKSAPVPGSDRLAQWVNAAFKNYQSNLALSRSPLANSPLVDPALVQDAVSPTADERGQALRLVLRWAVSRLAPSSVTYPLGTYRAFDDPTWRNPLWWRYNILRHRYLEPLHPDDFVEGGRYTETLLALTGIPSADIFYQERNRAIREVAQHLHQQWSDSSTTDTASLETTGLDSEGARIRPDGRQHATRLQQMALEEVYRPLRRRRHEREVLSIAATFDDVFPRALLLDMAESEQILQAEAALQFLVSRRFLLNGDEGTSLWISPALRGYVYQMESSTVHKRRHRRVARYYQVKGEPLRAAEHWYYAGRADEAATLLLRTYDELVDDLQVEDLYRTLERLADVPYGPGDGSTTRTDEGSLAPDQWREVHVRLADLSMRLGQRDAALAACRRALRVTDDLSHQARIYRRMGKLYEMHNPLHALTYYQQAADRFDPSDPELIVLLKDRGWLHIMRQEWKAAHEDLSTALARAPADRAESRADILDALASLYRQQKAYEPALEHAREALSLREESGDLFQIAKSFNNLGLLYRARGNYSDAVSAYSDAMSVYRKLGNQELIATTLLNMGTAHHLDGHLGLAVDAYQQCLTFCQEIDYPLVQVKAHSNLAEALAQLDQTTLARRHWKEGFDLSLQHGFSDQLDYFRSLQQQLPALAEIETEQPTSSPQTAAKEVQTVSLDLESRTALQLARKTGQVTARDLAEAADVSKSTATRRLADLVDSGHLCRHGKGRGTYYTPSKDNREAADLDNISRPRADHLDDDPLYRDIAPQLRNVGMHIARTYSVQAIGLIESAPERLRLVLRFKSQPDLLRFFELEKMLSQHLRAEVDLVPEAAATARDERPAWWISFS